jgi:hypothetical protein
LRVRPSFPDATPVSISPTLPLFPAHAPLFSGPPASGPVLSSNGALVVPCKNAVEVINSATGSSAWSTSIAPANQVGGVAVVEAEGGGATIVMTAFDGSLILLKSSRETVPLVTQAAAATSFAAPQPLNSSTPIAAANQTNSSTAIKLPVAAVTAAPPPTPPSPPAQAATAPFLGAIMFVPLLPRSSCSRHPLRLRTCSRTVCQCVCGCARPCCRPLGAQALALSQQGAREGAQACAVAGQGGAGCQAAADGGAGAP